MKGRSFLFSVLAFSIVVELVIIIAVYWKIGAERLPGQLGRLIVQLVLIAWLYLGRSNSALFFLVAYHVLVALLGLASVAHHNWLTYLLLGYLLGMALTLYLHDFFESKEPDKG